MDKNFLSVTEVNFMARTLLEQITVWVMGEVEGYEDGYRSAVYFKLKDGVSVLPCMFWKHEQMGYYPKDGEKVLLFGTLTLYEKSGKFQMVVSKIEAYGEGELLKLREELKRKLAAEGYFDEAKKRPIPALPGKIGLITSKRGAAIQDFMTNVVKSYEGLDVLFVDALVQGDKAPQSIKEAFERLGKENLDLVVLTRGGGDVEDLMCFNTEEVVKAIRACPFPVISAVGHEIDYTLSDLASDLRVSTPTKAAEVIASSYAVFKTDFELLHRKLTSLYERVHNELLFKLDLMESMLRRTAALYSGLPAELAHVQDRLQTLVTAVIDRFAFQLGLELNRLEMLSPKAVLERGYALAFDKNGKLVQSIKSVSVSDQLVLKLSDGTASVSVEGTANDR